MKKTAIIRSMTLALGLAMFLILAGASEALAGTVNLPELIVPRGGSADSATFNVTDTGAFTVGAYLKTNIICPPFISPNNSSRYRLQLMRGTTVVATVERVAGCSNYVEQDIPFTVATCAQTGVYRVRITNISADNPQEGKVGFFRFQVPTLTATSGKLSKFGVTQGNTINRNIPATLEPQGSGGRLRISATWDSLCGFDVSGCRLTFVLKRNGNEVTRSNGYASNALFGNASPKMSISHLVPAGQVSGDWTFDVIGNSQANVSNVEPTVSFTPACQN